MSNTKHECCTPKGQVSRYVDCVGCDKKPIEIMEKKQSSVELFAIALYEKGFLKGNGNGINDLLEEHKAMHKEEIIDAYWFGGQDVPMHINTCKRYYNETFNNENTDTTT